jgi:hypothetical protein
MTPQQARQRILILKIITAFGAGVVTIAVLPALGNAVHPLFLIAFLAAVFALVWWVLVQMDRQWQSDEATTVNDDRDLWRVAEEALFEDDVDLREAARKVLMEGSPAGAAFRRRVSVLSRALIIPDQARRETAAQTLTLIGESSIFAVQPLLDHPDEDVRQLATAIVTRIQCVGASQRTSR